MTSSPATPATPATADTSHRSAGATGTDGVAATVEEARAWLAEHWTDEHRAGRFSPKAWRETVVRARWAALRWPVEHHGRSLSDDDAKQVEAVFAEVGAPGPGQDRTNLWAGTMLASGSDELKRRFIEPLLLDDVAMCLLYSEPGAGSDLAGLRTTAVRDGDEWVVNGQKVWTSGGKDADYGMLIARTNWDVPKHRGITFFWFPMRQPGVEVRPLRQMTGDSRFNEVFMTDARVPDSHRLGEEGAGWWVLQTALAYERAVMGMVGSRPAAEPDAEPEGATAKAHGRIPSPDVSLVSVAHDVAKATDPVVRQGLARLYTLRKVNAWNGSRASAAVAGGGSSPLHSLGKLAMSGILHSAGRLHGHLLGMEGTLDGDDHPAARDANYSQLNAYFTSIGGGTDQIQRNIIGERILGLPREPELDRDVPFRDVPASTARRA